MAYVDFHVTAATLSPLLLISAHVLTRWMAEGIDGAPRLTGVFRGIASLMGYLFMLVAVVVVAWNLAVLMGGMRTTYDGRYMTWFGLITLMLYAAIGSYFSAHPPRRRTHFGFRRKESARRPAVARGADQGGGASAGALDQVAPAIDATAAGVLVPEVRGRRPRATASVALLLGGAAFVGGMSVDRLVRRLRRTG